jgi:hypothetical protein
VKRIAHGAESIGLFEFVGFRSNKLPDVVVSTLQGQAPYILITGQAG